MALAEVAIVAETRDGQTKPKHIRENGYIPAVLYSKGKEAQSLQVEYQSFRKAYRQTGDSTPLTLEIGGKKVITLVHDIQYEPVYDTYDHIDFLELNEKEPVKASIPVTLEGLSPAVKNLLGTLVNPTDHIEISSLPKHLIHNITVDVSGIEDFHTSIHISELPIAQDKNITILTDESAVIASVSPPKGGSKNTEEEEEGESAE